MRYQKIVLAGGNGYLGTVLARYYKTIAEEIIVLSRKPAAKQGNITTVVWDGIHEGEWTRSLEDADLLVNLCGKNVNCRYNGSNRSAILSSRIVPTRLLGKVITQLTHPPALWINITSATIYRHAEDHSQDEDTGEIGYGFSIDICRQWEASFNECVTPETRKVALRMGIVLGRQDGVFPRLLNLVKLGMGGKQGDGNQYIAWIHEYDAARCTQWLLDHKELEGVFNGTAPEAVKNAAFMKAMRTAYGIPFGLPAPQWLLEIGAVVIGTEPELILKSRWVTPARLIDSGYKFSFSKASSAIHDILSTSV